jgi:uncharacterized protein involved in type VI secretion and phage assembly
MSSRSNANNPVGTYQSLPTVEIDGERDPADFMADLLQITVEESIHLPAMFTLVLRNDYQSATPEQPVWKHENLLVMGKKVKIGFKPGTTSNDESNSSNGDSASSDSDEFLIEGEITAIETHFSDRTQAPIIIRGYDVSHRLHRGRFNRSFQNVTDSDIIKKIIDEVGIKEGIIDESGIPHDYVFQSNQSNMSFLRERAARLGYELFVQDGELNFRAPKNSQTLNLKWLRDISSFKVRVTSAEQVQEVEVRGWDYKSKRPFISTVQSQNLLTQTDNGDGKDSSTAFDDKPNNPKMLLVDRPVFQSKEADMMAQSLYDELAGQYVQADAKGDGNPSIRPGRVVELENMGPHSGQYYVTETCHTYSDRLYTTEFSVRGLRCGDLLATLSSPNHLQPGQTMLVGIVTDNEDPDGMGRVKVMFPTLTEEHNSNWARVVSMGAGASRGFDCLPEIDDEVLVAFEHGDIHRPYVIGGVWNGSDSPPNAPDDNVQGGKVRLRTFQTRTGHKLQFVEEDKSEKTGIYITSKQGYKIEINETEGFMNIATPMGQQYKISDTENMITTLTPAGSVQNQVPVGMITTTAGGAISTTSSANIALSAPTISLTAPAISLIGIPTISSPGVVPITAAGAFSVTSAVATLTAAGAVSLTGGAAVNINSPGLITIAAPRIALVGLVTINGLTVLTGPPPPLPI